MQPIILTAVVDEKRRIMIDLPDDHLKNVTELAAASAEGLLTDNPTAHP